MNTVNKLQDFSTNRPWLTFLVLVTLGTMMFLLLGCGSDNTSVSAKKEKAAKSSKAANSSTITPLLATKGEVRQVSPNQLPAVKIPGMLSEEELSAKADKQRAEFAKRNPATIEAYPGVTLEQLNAKLAESRAKTVEPKQVMPGVSREQLQAKLEESRAKNKTIEVMPGVTQEELDAKLSQARQQREPEGSTINK